MVSLDFLLLQILMHVKQPQFNCVQKTQVPGVGERQQGDRRDLFPHVSHPGLHRDRLLCRHLQRTGQGMYVQLSAWDKGAHYSLHALHHSQMGAFQSWLLWRVFMKT